MASAGRGSATISKPAGEKPPEGAGGAHAPPLLLLWREPVAAQAPLTVCPLLTVLRSCSSSPKATGSARRSPRPPTRHRRARTRCCRSPCAGAAAAHTWRRKCASAGSSWWTWRARSGRPRFASSPSPSGSPSGRGVSSTWISARPRGGPPSVRRANASAAGAGARPSRGASRAAGPERSRDTDGRHPGPPSGAHSPWGGRETDV